MTVHDQLDRIVAAVTAIISNEPELAARMLAYDDPNPVDVHEILGLTIGLLASALSELAEECRIAPLDAVQTLAMSVERSRPTEHPS